MIVSSKLIINKRYIPYVAWWLEIGSRDQIKLIWYCYFNIKQYFTTQKSPHTKCEKPLLCAKECQQSERQGTDLFSVFNKVRQIPEVI